MDGTAPTAAELLAHTDWLTRLARALVGDATAGDVVQATYGKPAAPERVTVALSPGAAVAGRVLDDAGRPVPGARVVATRQVATSPSGAARSLDAASSPR
jgi:protocatechuate 3,4-dioxygenase beta subunit